VLQDKYLSVQGYTASQVQLIMGFQIPIIFSSVVYKTASENESSESTEQILEFSQ
jgi:hypothetical protein